MIASQEMLGLFFAVSLVSTATPGPSVLYVTSQGLSGGMRWAAAASFGILAADAFYILLSITGLTALLLASYELFVLVKWAGAVYLVYYGWRLIRSGLAASPTDTEPRPDAPLSHRSFLGGFVLHAGNPKAILYFGSLVPQFVDQSRPVAGQLVTLAVVHLLTASAVLCTYSVLSAWFRRWAAGGRLRRVFQVSTGTFLIGAGVSLLLARKAAQS